MRTDEPSGPRVAAAVASLLVAVAPGRLLAATLRGQHRHSCALDPQVIKPGTLTVCTSIPYEPFEFEKDGEPVGFDIDLADEVARSELELKPRHRQRGLRRHRLG